MDAVYHICSHLYPKCGTMVNVVTVRTQQQVKKPRLNEPATRGSFHLPDRHALSLRELASEQGHSFNAEVREAVRLYLAVKREAD